MRPQAPFDKLRAQVFGFQAKPALVPYSLNAAQKNKKISCAGFQSFQLGNPSLGSFASYGKQSLMLVRSQAGAHMRQLKDAALPGNYKEDR
jgi:hypothetical protein